MPIPSLIVPYFSQWESPDLTLAILAEGGDTALVRDPHWAASGALTVEDYARWAVHVCGMACLKMVLAARTGRIVPTLELARRCTAYGGYVITPEDGSIKGLIYAPFVRFIAGEFGIAGQTIVDITVDDLPAILARSDVFMASVHPAIRWPDQEPPAKGGHLVLVTAANPERIVFHNPSGHDPASQANVALSPATFARFFAGRGVALGKGDAGTASPHFMGDPSAPK